MTETQTRSPSVTSTSNFEGFTGNWVNPDNVFASDNARATSSPNGVSTAALAATGFGFDIPAGSTIEGILLEVEGSRSSATSWPFHSQLLKNSIVEGEKANSLAFPQTTEAYVSAGGAADLWGAAWSPADINSATFRVQMFRANAVSGTVTFAIDHVRVTVYYAPPPMVDVEGVQGAPSGALVATGLTGIAGAPGAPSGDVAGVPMVLPTGTQAAPSGELEAQQSLGRATEGAQGEPSATLFVGVTTYLSGLQGAPAGALAMQQSLARAIAGLQAAGFGVVYGPEDVGLAGEQGAPSGVLVVYELPVVAMHLPAGRTRVGAMAAGRSRVRR